MKRMLWERRVEDNHKFCYSLSHVGYSECDRRRSHIKGGHGILYRDYILFWDPCPFGQPIALTIAHVRSESARRKPYSRSQKVGR